jgi:DNA-binding beta-propeller fold protein YncE
MIPVRNILSVRRPVVCMLVALVTAALLAEPVCAGEAYKWSLQYLIDNSRTIFGRSQKVSPRHNRGLAISPDGKFLYAGYSHSYNNAGEVRMISVDTVDFDRASYAVVQGPMGKAIATDDKGRVYISDETSILVYDGGLHTRQLDIPANACEGVAVTREGRDLVLYTSDREQGALNRKVLHEKDGAVVSATPNGFDGTGTLKIHGATDLRGLKVDPKGNCWIADLKGSKVWKVSHDGKTVTSASVNTPMDLAFDNGRVLVTRYMDRVISILDENMQVLGTLTVPWEELALNPLGNSRSGALSGIVTVPGKCFYLANEAGLTANQRSTYGRVDEQSGVVGGKLYKDIFEDDNEPILKATVIKSGP